MYEYDLFAVINHEGQMDNGHYTNFARFRDEVGFFLPFDGCSAVEVYAVVSFRRRQVRVWL